MSLRSYSRKLLALGAALVLAVALLPALGFFSASPARAATTVTPVPVNGSCNGLIPTPGSENTLKKLIGGTLQPGGTAEYEITYPLSAADVGTTFTVLDCPVIGGDINGAQVYEFTVVPSNQIFDVIFTLTIPANTPIGTTYCNYAKTTGPPTAPQASNRKAGPACFTVGGNLRIEKHATGSSTLLPGAQFTVSCPTPAPTTPPSAPNVEISGLVDGTGTAVTASYVTAHNAWEAAGTATPGAIGIAGPSGTVCTVTETAPPTGYTQIAPASRSYTIPVGTAQTVVAWNNDPAGSPALHLVKSASPASGSTVGVGDTIAYTLTYYNDGTAYATNATITDVVPTHTTLVANSISNGGTYDSATRTITWTGVNVAKGTSAASPAGTRTFSVTVDAGTTNGTTISNQGHIQLTGAAVVDSNTTTHTVFVGTPALHLVKSANPPSGSTVGVGATITYTLSYYNDGTADATNTTITDVVPTHTTLVANSISNGGTYNSTTRTITWTGVNVAKGTSATSPAGTRTFSVTVDAGTTNGTTISNQGQIQLGATTVNSNTTTHNVFVGVVSLSSAKTSVPASGTVQAPTPVTPGQQIDYAIAITNSGNLGATGVVVTDAIPAGTSYVAGSADSGGTLNGGTLSWTVNVPALTTVTVHFSVTVDAGTANGTLIDNVASVNNVATNATHHVVQYPVLAMGKSSTPQSGAIVQPGGSIEYVIEVTNSGLADAPDVVVTDTLPDHVTVQPGATPAPTTATATTLTWTVTVPAASTVNGQLVPGSVMIHYVVTVDSDAPQGATLTNVALANGQCLGNATNDPCTTEHFVATGALTLVKHVDKTSAEFGDTLTYTFDVVNNGTLDQPNVVVTDTLPDGTTYVAGSAGCTDTGTCDASYDAASRTLTWKVGDLTDDAVRHLTFQVTVDKPTPAADGSIPAATILNVGSVSSDVTPATPSNQVKTGIVAVLGEKKTRPKPLPFTGLPAVELAAVGALLMAAGAFLTARRRRTD